MEDLGDATANAREVVERYAKAWLDEDLDGILGCYGDDFTLHYFGDNPHSGDHVGRDAAVATLLAVGAKAPRKLLSVDEVLAGPDAAVLVVTESLTVDGEAREIRRVLRFRIAGPALAECWLYDEDQALIDRAWA